MTSDYDPNRAQEIVKETFIEKPGAEEQAQALVDLEPIDLRQVLIGILMGDV